MVVLHFFRRPVLAAAAEQRLIAQYNDQVASKVCAC